MADGAHESTNGVARSCDISKTGVGMFTSRPLPVEAHVFLEMTTKLGNMSVVGKIVHCAELREGYFRVGIRLEIVPPGDRATLARILVQ